MTGGAVERDAAPFAGLRVLDLSRVMSGPYCTAMLADLGADVVKVEAPGQGDDARAFGPFVGGASVYYALLNRGKRSIALDLKNARARLIAQQLAAVSDVVVENFRPGVAARLGMDHATLSALNPKLVYLSISGFGQTGPRRDWPAYDLVVQAMAGLMSVTGAPDGEPTAVGESIADVVTGVFGAWAIAAALHARARDGHGGHVDLAMFDSVFALQLTRIAQLQAAGAAPARVGNRHPVTSPVDMVRTRDGHLVLVAPGDAMFAALCRAIGQPQLADDARFSTNALRWQHGDLLHTIIEGWSLCHDTEAALAALHAAAIPAGPVWNLAQAAASDHAQARRLVVDLPHPRFGTLGVVPQPARFAGVPQSLRIEPALGADGAGVLGDWLRLTPAEIVALQHDGVLPEPTA